jgi:hypothetical protein
MNGVYKSLKGKVQETLQLGKANAAPPEAGRNIPGDPNFREEIEHLEQAFIERVSKLREALAQSESSRVGQAQHSEQVASDLKANIAALEAKLRAAEESIRKKDSSRQQIEETLKARIQELLNENKKREEALAARLKESGDLKATLEAKEKTWRELESAVEKAKQEATNHCRRADNIAAASRAKIETLESDLRKQQDVTRQKDAMVLELEQKLAAKNQEHESLIRNKQEVIAARDAVIADLRAQLKLLTKGIGEMSSFFKQAQAFALVEGQEAASTGGDTPPPPREPRVEPRPAAMDTLPNGQHAAHPDAQRVIPPESGNAPTSAASTVTAKPVQRPMAPAEAKPNPEDKPVTLQGAVRNNSARPASRGDSLSPLVFERMAEELAEASGVMAPLAALIVREHVEGLGESMASFPKARLPELLESLSRELLDEQRRSDFRRRLVQRAQMDA